MNIRNFPKSMRQAFTAKRYEPRPYRRAMLTSTLKGCLRSIDSDLAEAKALRERLDRVNARIKPIADRIERIADILNRRGLARTLDEMIFEIQKRHLPE